MQCLKSTLYCFSLCGETAGSIISFLGIYFVVHVSYPSPSKLHYILTQLGTLVYLINTEMYVKRGHSIEKGRSSFVCYHVCVYITCVYQIKPSKSNTIIPNNKNKISVWKKEHNLSTFEFMWWGDKKRQETVRQQWGRCGRSEHGREEGGCRQGKAIIAGISQANRSCKNNRIQSTRRIN